MSEPENHTLALLRRIDAKLDARFDSLAARLDRVEASLAEVKDELLVTNGIVLRLEAREVEAVGLKALYDRLARRVTKLEEAAPS